MDTFLPCATCIDKLFIIINRPFRTVPLLIIYTFHLVIVLQPEMTQVTEYRALQHSGQSQLNPMSVKMAFNNTKIKLNIRNSLQPLSVHKSIRNNHRQFS